MIMLIQFILRILINHQPSTQFSLKNIMITESEISVRNWYSFFSIRLDLLVLNRKKLNAKIHRKPHFPSIFSILKEVIWPNAISMLFLNDSIQVFKNVHYLLYADELKIFLQIQYSSPCLNQWIIV